MFSSFYGSFPGRLSGEPVRRRRFQQSGYGARTPVHVFHNSIFPSNQNRLPDKAPQTSLVVMLLGLVDLDCYGARTRTSGPNLLVSFISLAHEYAKTQKRLENDGQRSITPQLEHFQVARASQLPLQALPQSRCHSVQGALTISSTRSQCSPKQS